ncbi:MAG: SH3 domain-containing protein [Anaerolineae bacterium]|nr:SH3 domain-containing protein [Anaerolineae bacterium]
MAVLRYCILCFLFISLASKAVLAQPGSARDCPLAPATRLHVGMTAVVSPLIGQVNLRALPAVSTGIETPLYQGNRVTVLAGPSCNRHFQWWRVETVNGRRGWVAEGTWENYYLIPTREFDAYPDYAIANPAEYSCPRHRPAVSRCIDP